MRKRVLVLSALSLGTGSGLRARYLCDALKRAGLDAVLVAPAGRPRPFSAEFLLSIPRFLWAARRPFDLAIGVKPYPNVWLALLACRLLGARTVVDVDDADGAYRGAWMGALTRLLQAPAFGIAHFATTHHPRLKAALQARLGSARVLDLPQGVDTHCFDARSRVESRHSGGPVLAFTAHLNIACQLDVLLKAVGPWLRSHPRARLLVAGGGPDEAWFRRLAEPWGTQIEFLGGMSSDGIAAVLARSDVGLSAYGDNPGNRHRVPMKVAEYLAMGLPVVTNLIEGLEPLRRFVGASALQPQVFGRNLDAALKPPARMKARQGRAFIRRYLAWDIVAKNLMVELNKRQRADLT